MSSGVCTPIFLGFEDLQRAMLTGVTIGLVTAGICNLCMATSLAEFLSAYPTAGGQYHWVAVTSWRRYMPILSWITGWVNCSGWVALVATGGLLGSQLILGVISLMNPVGLPPAACSCTYADF